MVSEQPSMASGSFSFAFSDSSSPYYLHHRDSPDSVLVSQVLQGDNYHTWSRSMIMALTAKNKLKFINGSLKKPFTELEDEFHPWNRSNNMVLSWILNSVSKDIATSVIYINLAEDMWNDLKDRFSQKNGPRIFQLQKAISSHSQQNLSVSEYYTRLKGFWDELTNYRPIPQCSCDTPRILADHSHQDYVFQFLMGLNDSFAQIRGQILLIDPLPSINKVFSLIVQEERQRAISVNPVQVETAALMTKTSLQYQNQLNRSGKPQFHK
jgi:hypothetical protein